MSESKQTKEKLLQRRDEINAQLGRVNKDLRMELDQDEEDRAIQTEQDDVAITIESNLRRELNEIEEQLIDLEED